MPKGFPKKGYRKKAMKSFLCKLCKQETCGIYESKTSKCEPCIMKELVRDRK